MSDNIALIDTEAENLADKLTTYSSEIESSFNNMRDTIAKMSACLEGEIANSISGKFSQFDEQIPFINENIQSYIQDFKNLVISFSDQNSSTSAKAVTMVNNEGGDLVNVNN